MKKQNRNSSMETSAKYKIPKIKVVNHSCLSTTSPSNSFYNNLNQPMFSLAPLLGLRNMQKLNKNQPKSKSISGAIENRNKKPKLCPEDIEYFEEYRKFEIKKSRKLVDEKFPFWFLYGLDTNMCPTLQGDLSSLKFTENDRKGFCTWSENLLLKLNNLK